MRHASSSSAYDLISALTDEALPDDERSALFDTLIERPITSQDIADGVRALREKMVPTHLRSEAIDTCGTGGSGMKTINTSTIAAFVVAASDVPVAKHGNRSASGNCGCFDLLEELGVQIDLTPDQEDEMFEQLGITFLYAKSHHPSMRFVAPLRTAYGHKTLFNFLGPLTSPASVSRQLIGTGNDADAELLAGALKELQMVGSRVVTGQDGLDEVTMTGPTTVRIIHRSTIETCEFSPEELSLQTCTADDLTGGTVHENARHFTKILQGKGDQHRTNLVLVNAAQAMLLAHPSLSVQDAFYRVQETLQSGSAYALFEEYADFSFAL